MHRRESHRTIALRQRFEIVLAELAQQDEDLVALGRDVDLVAFAELESRFGKLDQVTRRKAAVPHCEPSPRFFVRA